MLKRFCVLFLLIVLSACQQDNEEELKMRAQLQGKWMTKKAYRQGRNTRLLNDFYLEFNEEQVQLNLPRESEVSWSLDEDTLLLSDHPLKKLIVHDLSDSMLKFSFDFNQYLYWVALEKERKIH